MKKAIKIAGHLLMLAAAVFLIRRILRMQIDPAEILQPHVIAALCLSTAVQTAVIVCGTYPWLVFTRALSGRSIPFRQAMPVFTRSNLYKYVPGNVFQYVGRNKLAEDAQVSHVDVACATVLDVLGCVISTGIISVILLGSAAFGLLRQYGGRLLLLGGIGILLLAAAVLVIRLKFRAQVRGCLERYRKAFAPESRGNLLRGAGYYLAQNAVSAAVYFCSLRLIFPAETASGTLVTMTGAFLFAWIIGFITPGAPGGIGIRESVMLLVSAQEYAQAVMLFVLVTRLASILADVLAFLIGTVFGRAQRREQTA